MSDLKEELGRCCGTVADKEAMAAEVAGLELVVKQLNDDVTAAKAHAKQLATDLEYSRHSWRLAQYHLTQVKAVLGGVACTLHTVNLGELASQLRGVAAGLESIDNGADAALVRRAGNLLDLFSMAIVDGKRL